jgi:hypothetical protein
MSISGKAPHRYGDVKRVHFPTSEQVHTGFLGKGKSAEVKAEGDFVTPHLYRDLAVNRSDCH